VSVIFDAKQFHPMRGHVEHGALIRFPNGETWRLASGMRGWVLRHDDGREAFAAPDAMSLTASIVRMADAMEAA
jgi:hypothetical protein